MFKRSLICTNLNDGLTRFTDYVPQLAASGLEQIVFVHNVPLWQEGNIPHVDQEKVTAATAKLAKALIKVPTGVEVKVEVPSGRLLDNICELITKYQSDVIFVSNSAKGNIQKTLFGSNLAGLTEKTSVPLFVLRPQLISTYREDELALRSQNLWRYLLVPYNGGEASNYLIQQLSDCLTKYGKGTTEKIMLCSVVDNSGKREELKEARLEEVNTQLAAAKAKLEPFDVEIVTEIREGNPFHEVMDIATVFDISAIAVANDYRKNILEFAFSHFANEILHQSWFPLLFFSPEK